MALRFLKTAQKTEENHEEKNMELLKNQSILLSSTLDFRPFRRDKKGQKTNLFLENDQSRKKISLLLRKFEGERASVTSQDDKGPKPRFSIESPFIPNFKEYLKSQTEEFSENDLQKPIFMYLPQEEEIKEMIFKVLKDIAKENEFLKSIKLTRKRKK